MTSDAQNMREYMARLYRDRVAWAREKLGSKCANCGSSDDLEFDHIDPKTKVLSISQMSTYSFIRFSAEVAKCQLLCESCHKAKSASERGLAGLARGTHGTISAYYWCGPPKCDLCKAAKRDAPSYRNRYRSKSVRQKPLHGSRAMFLRGCKCVECLAANAKYARELRARRKSMHAVLAGESGIL